MDLQGRPEPEALAGPAVERIVHRGDLVVAGECEVGALGEVLAHQAVGVLVGPPPLPGGGGAARSTRAPRGPRRPRRVGELLTAVHGYRLARLPGEGRDLRGGYVGLRVGGVPAARQEAAPAVHECDEAGAGPRPTTVSPSQSPGRERDSAAAGLSDMGASPPGSCCASPPGPGAAPPPAPRCEALCFVKLI